MKKQDQPDLTVPEVAALLGLHPESVRRLARQNRLPFMYRLGGSWRGCRAELAAFKRAGGTQGVGRPSKSQETQTNE